MTTAVRYPPLEVYIDGQRIPKVLSARVTRGLDQEFATGEIVVPHPLPTWVKLWQWTAVRMGANPGTITERLVGYINGFSYELWPSAVTIHVADPLVLCTRFWPTVDVSLQGMNDAQIVSAVLNEVGFPGSLIASIEGTGLVLSDDELTWPLAESAMELIKEVDGMSLGFRTYCGTDGAVRRRYFDVNPSSAEMFTFTEGVDIIEGQVDFAVVEPQNEITVNGDGDITATVTGVSAFRTVPTSPVNYPKIFYADPDSVHINATDVAGWLLDQKNRWLITCNISTQRDDPISMGTTALVESAHLWLDQRFWIQSITTEVTMQGLFRQQLQLVSELSQSALLPGVVDPLSPGMPEIDIDPPVSPTFDMPTPPVVGPQAGFTIISIDKELVVIGGVETWIYTVSCTDASAPYNAPITTYAWTATGPGVGIASGSEANFTTYFTDLTGATITLEVTDSLSQTGTFARDLTGGAGIPIKIRILYAATDDAWEAFDGEQWNIESHDPMTSIGSGPRAGGGTDFLITEDDLKTPAALVVPFTGGDTVSAVWIEADVSGTNVAAGSAAGQVGVSDDGGTTWTIKPGPNVGQEIRRIIISRFTEGQILLIDETGFYTSGDNGDTWALQRAGDFSDLILSHSRNVVVTTAGALQRAEAPGESFTFPGSPTIVCATAHIREDKFFAQDSAGVCYVTTTSGGWAMSALETIPDGTPQVRGMYRDGDFPDIIYFAAGDGGLWKTITAFKTAAGFLQLRAP